MSDYENDSDNESISVSSDSEDEVIARPKLKIGAELTGEELTDDEAEDLHSDEDEDIIEEDDDTSDDENLDLESDVEEDVAKVSKKPQTIAKPTMIYDDDDEDMDDQYLQKFDSDMKKNYIHSFHPECLIHNYEEIARMTVVVRDEFGIIVDPLHKTIPFLTKYEKARILGQRSKQLETGAKPFIDVPPNIIDGYVIAEMELKQKKIPFIIKRPIPGGAFEYWNLRDLEFIAL